MDAAADQEVDPLLARTWVPPVEFGDARPLMSIDGQIYYACSACGNELRESPVHASGSVTGGLPCAACGGSYDRYVVHAAVYQCTCVDCGTEQTIATIETRDLECANCRSRRVSVHATRVEPPFPASFTQGFGWEEATAAPEIFADVVRRTRHVWGLDEAEDIATLHREMLMVDRRRAGFSDYLVWGARYVRRLRSYGGHPSTIGLIGYEASMLKERCKREHDLWAGLEALEDQYELMEAGADDEYKLAVGAMGFADTAYSLMHAFGEGALMEHFDEPLRDLAVAAAEQALDYFLHADDNGSTSDLIAQAQWSLGNLLSLPSDLDVAATFGGETQDAVEALVSAGRWPKSLDDADRDGRLRRAVILLSQALDSGRLTETWARGVRNSRVSAILQLDDADEATTRTAIEDLEQMTSELSDLDEPGAVRLFLNLATVKQRVGEREAAMELRELVARHALLESDRAVDEDDVHRQSEEFVEVFDELALEYAAQGRAMSSLCAVELGRSAATRYYTRSDEEQAAAATRADERRTRDAVDWLLATMGASTDAQSYRPFDDHLGDVETALRTGSFASGSARGAGYLSYCLWRDEVLAHIAVPDADGGLDVQAVSWTAEVLDLLRALDASEIWEPGTWREERLGDVCSLARECLWRPIEDLVSDLDVSTLIISAPGGLCSVPFEAVASLDPNGRTIPAISYAPSLRVLDDLRIRPTSLGSAALPRVLAVQFQGDDLPGVAEEMGMLRQTLGDRLTIVDSDAHTRHDLLSLLVAEDWDIIHFACHGTFDSLDPWRSSLHLVPDPQRDRERLSARDLVGLRFGRSPLVVLSACSSALTSGSRSVDSAGLTGGFLRAGARGIVASRWPVYDDLAVAFMTGFYARIAHGDPPDWAVAAVQQELRRDWAIEDWAAFAYVGGTSVERLST
jgi:CHAT domain-containing protein/DNA-directed RNA polymerase subunit RPC12/RpoP